RRAVHCAPRASREPGNPLVVRPHRSNSLHYCYYCYYYHCRRRANDTTHAHTGPFFPQVVAQDVALLGAAHSAIRERRKGEDATQPLARQLHPSRRQGGTTPHTTTPAFPFI